MPSRQSSDLDAKLDKISVASGPSAYILRTEFLNYELSACHSKVMLRAMIELNNLEPNTNGKCTCTRTTMEVNNLE